MGLLDADIQLHCLLTNLPLLKVSILNTSESLQTYGSTVGMFVGTIVGKFDSSEVGFDECMSEGDNDGPLVASEDGWLVGQLSHERGHSSWTNSP